MKDKGDTNALSPRLLSCLSAPTLGDVCVHAAVIVLPFIAHRQLLSLSFPRPLFALRIAQTAAGQAGGDVHGWERHQGKGAWGSLGKEFQIRSKYSSPAFQAHRTTAATFTQASPRP